MEYYGVCPALRGEPFEMSLEALRCCFGCDYREECMWLVDRYPMAYRADEMAEDGTD